MDIFVKYLKRCNLMLQQGQYVADVAYFIGEDAPKLMGTTDPALPRGYSFDYINAEMINACSVKNGKLILPGGMSYRILILPRQTTIRPELLSKIRMLVRDGALIPQVQPTQSTTLIDWNNIQLKVFSTSPEANGLICLPSEQALHLLNAGKKGKSFVLAPNTLGKTHFSVTSFTE